MKTAYNLYENCLTSFYLCYGNSLCYKCLIKSCLSKQDLCICVVGMPVSYEFYFLIVIERRRKLIRENAFLNILVLKFFSIFSKYFIMHSVMFILCVDMETRNKIR
jgi:hypothetical protein